MTTLEAKDYALDQCQHWPMLNALDIEKSLPENARFIGWQCNPNDDGFVPATCQVDLSIGGLTNGEFVAWARRFWRWSGHYRVYLASDDYTMAVASVYTTVSFSWLGKSVQTPLRYGKP